MSTPTTKPVLKSRLIVVESVYHQHFGAEPESFDSRYSRWLDVVEQVYKRELTITEDWQLLDHGWIKNASLLLVSNIEGKALLRNPTEQERSDLKSHVVELGVAIAGPEGEARYIRSFSYIPPGESTRLCNPLPLNDLRLRCSSGSARCQILIVPN